MVKGRLDTRYSPVRRSPSSVASNRHAAPRLACVKPVASVHPEPGSNSTLYFFISLTSFVYHYYDSQMISLFFFDSKIIGIFPTGIDSLCNLLQLF